MTWEQIELYSSKLEITPEELIHLDAPVFNSNHQQGGHANNYIIQNGTEVAIAAKDETIAALQALLREKDIHIQILEAEIVQPEFYPVFITGQGIRAYYRALWTAQLE